MHMPNIGTILKQEISRLCRREVRKEIEATRKASASYRRDIAALKRQVTSLERQSASLAKRAISAGDRGPPSLPDRPVRFVAKGLRSLRKRLGLSAPQLAQLLGVSEQSVYNWETKKATPRKEQFAAIISMRDMGKREANRRLVALKAPKVKKRGKAEK